MAIRNFRFPIFSQNQNSSASQLPWRTFLLLTLIILSGCATSHHDKGVARRPFNFRTDTFAFNNQLVWEYYYDEHSNWVSRARSPRPDYSHHCFVLARSAKQFFEHARFDPAQPVADTNTYNHLIFRVVSIPAQRSLPDKDRIVIPGYANLHDFSAAQEPLLKAQCGPAWQSYFQHGHWRMLLPFSRHQQEKMSERLLGDLRENQPPVVHLVRFPSLTINHAVVLFDGKETEKNIQFFAYDPNNPKAPVILTFDRATRTFLYPANDYYPGGRVDVYEVYRNFLY